jgi:hypothetical protein
MAAPSFGGLILKTLQALMFAVVVLRKDLKHDTLVAIAIAFIYNYVGMFYGNKFVLKEDGDGDRGGECHNKMSVRVVRCD